MKVAALPQSCIRAVHRRRKGGLRPPRPPSPPPPPLPMFEADSQNFAAAPSVPRAEAAGTIGGPSEEGGSQPNPPSPAPLQTPPPPLLPHPCPCPMPQCEGEPQRQIPTRLPGIALQHFGNFKSHTLNIYLLHRCWQFEPDLPLDFLACSRVCIQRAFGAARAYLMSRVERDKHEHLKTFYDTVSEITLMNDVLRLSGLPAPLVTVVAGDLRDSLDAFERLRCFSDYRTPSGIRAFMRLCQYLIPLLLTPYFATLASPDHPAGVPARCPASPLPPSRIAHPRLCPPPPPPPPPISLSVCLSVSDAPRWVAAPHCRCGTVSLSPTLGVPRMPQGKSGF